MKNGFNRQKDKATIAAKLWKPENRQQIINFT